LIGSASPWVTYRSTAPQWSWSYSCFALKSQLKVSFFSPKQLPNSQYLLIVVI
jgi:hypothetical protein